MFSAVVELTNRCNLQCHHCAEERHAGDGDMALTIVERLLAEGRDCGVRHFSFTGGEPTIHRSFRAIVQRVADAGYRFSLVSNGMTFPKIHPVLLKHRAYFTGITFSLDGAQEQTHDRLRGAGSYRRVMKAVSVCVARDIPFFINMVLTRHNLAEVEEMVATAAALGSGGVRFGQLMFNPEVGASNLDLSAEERQQVEERIRQLQADASIAVGMAPGYYSESPFYPCGPLTLKEFNVDYRGNVTLCCHLSGHFRPGETRHVLGNLHDISLADSLENLRTLVDQYLFDKRRRVQAGEFEKLDHFPCWYCVNYLGKHQGHQIVAMRSAQSM